MLLSKVGTTNLSYENAVLFFPCNVKVAVDISEIFLY